MRKRAFTVVLTLCLALGCTDYSAAASMIGPDDGADGLPFSGIPYAYNPKWRVILGGAATDIEVVRVGRRVYVEAAETFTALGWVVFWHDDGLRIAANSRGGGLLTHTVGTALFTVNNSAINCGDPSVTIGGTLYIPLSVLDALLPVGQVTKDTRRRIIHIQKAFVSDELHGQIAKILAQSAILDNYNPLLFHSYIQYGREHPSIPADKVVLYVNIGAHVPLYSDIQPVENPHDVFFIVDKNHKFASDFVPELSLIDGFYWNRDAGAAWVKMKAAARADGVTLSLSNTYRSIAYQTLNYNRKISGGRSVADVDAWNSRPGHSEHHTGYAADMAGLNKFTGTRAHTWLLANGYKFGFLTSFQVRNEDISQYEPESWHIRWYPLWAAQIMYDEGLSVREFDNLYLNPRKHGYSTDKGLARIIAEADYAALSPAATTNMEYVAD